MHNLDLDIQVMFPKILAAIVLVISILIDVKYIQFIINPDIQLLLGTIVVAIVIFFDSISGLILGLSLLITYLRVYAKKYNINLSEIITNKQTKNYPNSPLVSSKYYITPKNLADAQNNIVNKDNYNTEVKGFTGAYNEPVYGVQGIDNMMPGYTNQFPGEMYQSASHEGGAAKGNGKYRNLNL
jgi:hypothetical protein